MDKSFVFYTEYKDKIALLNGKQTKQLLLALIEYVETGQESKLDTAAGITFNFIRDDICRAKERYKKAVEKGKKGGAPKNNNNAFKQDKTTKNNLKQPKTTYEEKNNLNVNVNDNDNDNDKDIKILSGKPDCDSPKTDNSVYREIIKYLNQQTNKMYKASSDKTKRLIDARINSGFALADFFKVIDTKSKQWSGTDMEKYLRPETLFGTKFEGYLQEGTHGDNGDNGKESFLGGQASELWYGEEV